MDPLQPWLDAKEVRRLAEGLLAAPPEVEQAAVDAAYGEIFEGFAGEGDTPDLSEIELAVKGEAGLVDAVKKLKGPVSKVSEMPDQDQPVAERASLTITEDSPFKISTSQEHRATDIMAVKASSGEQTHEVYKLPSADQELARNSSSEATGSNEPIRNLQAKGPFLSRIRQFSQVIREDLGAKAMFLIDVNGQVLLDEVENAKLIQVARTLANASQRANRQSAGAAAVGNLHVKIGASSTLEVIPVDSRYGLLILGVVFPGPIGAIRVMEVADELHRTIEPRL